MAARRAGADTLAARVNTQFPSRPWRTRGARWQNEPTHQILTGYTDSVEAVACATLPDGHTVAVIASRDKTVQVWDLAIGGQVGQPLTGHRRPVEAVACVTLPDRRTVGRHRQRGRDGAGL
jgi:WD40 repeat protein